MARMRITIEYPLNESDPTQEQRDWINGDVTFQDIWYLFNEGEAEVRVRFETIGGNDE